MSVSQSLGSAPVRPLVRLLAVAAVTALSAGAAWQDRGSVTAPAGNLTFTCRWQPAHGLHLRVVKPDTNQTALLLLKPGTGEAAFLPERKYPLGLAQGAQFNPEVLPQQATDNLAVLMKFRTEGWTVYVNKRAVAVLPVPFLLPGTVQQDSDELPLGTPPPPAFQKVADFAFADDFLVPEGEENLLAAWERVSGEWQLHTAADNSVERQLISATAARKPVPAQSPNFYSLQGKGTNAVILAGYDFYDSYRLEAAMQTVAGETGLVFYVQEDGSYHAFTATLTDDSRAALLRLWRVRKTGTGVARETLAAAATQLTAGQWLKLKVAVFPQRLQAFVDNTRVFDLPAELPPGGRFGLFASTANGARFDDVAAVTNHELDLTNAADVRRHTLVQRGSFFGDRARFSLFGHQARESSGPLLVAEARDDQWLVLGSPLHPGHVFSTTFAPSGSRYAVGLVTGYTDAASPHFRFLCTARSGAYRAELQSVAPGGGKPVVLEQTPLPGLAAGTPLTLMCDTTSTGELRCYRNGELVLIHHPAKPLGGGSGVFVGAKTQTGVQSLSWNTERRDLNRNRFEKNRIYIEDPFMRHWSSPEGEWADDDQGRTWHKGDFYGRFLVRLPHASGSTLHVGIPESGVNGAYAVLATETGISLHTGDQAVAGKAPLLAAPLASLQDIPGAEGKPSPGKWYSLHYEGYWLWLTSGDKVLGKLRVAQPFSGHRIRISGINTELLQHSYVERFNVKDFLFTESLHEWVINGGSWEVINRFQCRPEWSHMNGENGTGLAAIWAKYRFGGDFCVEMYAGMRMGWYARPGDLNMTVMNRDTTPSEGYSVTCTGWDPDHSQLYTRLYRDGIPSAQSDKYCVPRVREGSRRMVLDPLIKPGRDIHGAWYYMKFRRVGTRLEFYFDNQLVFTAEDKQPLNDGSLGVWTFLNSMMVARVKIAAQRIEPLQARMVPLGVEAERRLAALPAKSAAPDGGAREADAIGNEELAYLEEIVGAPAATLPSADLELPAAAGPAAKPGAAADAAKTAILLADDPASARRKAAAPPPAAPVRLTNADRPLDAMQPEYWVADDPVGHAELTWNKTPEGQPFFMMRNILGSGTLMTRCALPPVPAAELAGWEFYVKRTARAQFNLHFATGSLDADNAFTPARNYFVVLSGSDLETGAFAFAGNAGLTATARREAGGLDKADWQRLVVWLPPEILAEAMGNPALRIQVRGFGNLQPSYVLAGLTGNGPREGYAVRDFREVRLLPPRLGLTGTTDAGTGFTVWAGAADKAPRTPTACSTLSNLQQWFERQQEPGWQQAVIELRGQPQSQKLPVSWINLPPQPDLSCRWSATHPGAIEVRCPAAYPEPRLATCQATVGTTVLQLAGRDFNLLRAVLPRDDAFTPAKIPAIALSVDGVKCQAALTLDWKATTVNEPPALMKVEGLTPFLETLENRALPTSLSADTSRMTVPLFDPRQGAYLRVSNAGTMARLRTVFTSSASLAQYPVFGWRYRGGATTRVSLALREKAFVEMSENYGLARTPRGSGRLLLDEQWHSWAGVLTDVISEWPVEHDRFACRSLRFGSAGEYDQTGLFSWLHADDLVMGPAKPSTATLTFTPLYFDTDGVAEVSTALCSAADATAPQLTPAQLAALPWRKAAPGTPIQLPLQGLGDGVARLCLKARDTKGTESPVTEIPILVDSKPPEVVAPPPGSAWCDSSANDMQVQFRIHGGAPLDIGELKVRWNDAPVDLPAKSCVLQHTVDTDTLVLNWPYLFRRQLDQVQNGQTHRIVVANLRDGAGNTAPDVTIPLAIDFAKDHAPPSLLTITWPATVLWSGNWDSVSVTDPGITVAKGDQVQQVVLSRKPNQAPTVQLLTLRETADFSVTFTRAPWELDKTPYLAFRIRRPKVTKENKARVDLVLECDTKEVYIVPLTHPDKGRNVLSLPQPVNWEGGEAWLPLVIDVRALFQSLNAKAEAKALLAAKPKDGAAPAVKADAEPAIPKRRIAALRFRTTEAPPRYLLELQSLMVLSPWRKEDKLPFDGFDTSGIGGLTWYVGTTRKALDTATLDLASVPMPVTEAGWLDVMLRDKAGNLTAPLHLPLCPTQPLPVKTVLDDHGDE